MIISETSFENWLRLTVLFETTKTSFAKTVAKKATGVGNAHNRECIAPMSSVVFVAEVRRILISSIQPVSHCLLAGHMARDCRGRGDPSLTQNKQTAFDSEYTALMAELGEGGGSTPGSAPAAAIGAPGAIPPQSRVPPWRLPENWQTSMLSSTIFYVSY